MVYLNCFLFSCVILTCIVAKHVFEMTTWTDKTELFAIFEPVQDNRLYSCALCCLLWNIPASEIRYCCYLTFLFLFLRSLHLTDSTFDFVTLFCTLFISNCCIQQLASTIQQDNKSSVSNCRWWTTTQPKVKWNIIDWKPRRLISGIYKQSALRKAEVVNNERVIWKDHILHAEDYRKKIICFI